MNNLILGGAGFIGQHLSHKLLNTRQERVTIVDNLDTAKFNIDDFADHKNLFEFIHADLNNIDTLELKRIFRRNHRIFHLASSVGVEYGDKDPKKTTYNNISLMNKIIPMFEESSKHVVFSSTSEIYGNGPTFREDDPSGIGSSSKLRWSYATSKLMSEFMIRASTFPYTIVRFFNVTGPGQLGNYGMVLPRFINSAKNNEDLLIYGDGNQIRSFCHVNDAVDALVKVSNINGEVFNIGNNHAVSMNELAEQVIQISGSSSKIVHVPYDQVFSSEYEDVMYRVPNLEKIISRIGYKPIHTLTNIIEDML